jgi:2',3'-cyclic-nucleotide 2'-phosphodiesterase
MRILFLGDIVGKTGREGVLRRLPGLRDQLSLDFVIVNGENAAHGFGITAKICDELFEVGVDVISTGNHVWDQKEALSFIEREDRLLRPVNFPPGTPGRGAGLYQTAGGENVLVINVMGRLFMDPLDDPFAAVERELSACPLGVAADAIVIDVHAETTSEKNAMGHFADGAASLVVGTHTHIPTADTRVLSGGTAYQTDAGMCGDYDSVIGMQKEEAVARFVRKYSSGRLQPGEGEASVCGLVVETGSNGLAKRVACLQVGGSLTDNLPDW